MMNVVALKKQTGDRPFSSNPVESFTIPSRYYLDTDIYTKVKEAIFYRNWWYGERANNRGSTRVRCARSHRYPHQ
jgi:hypothetical protein